MKKSEFPHELVYANCSECAYTDYPHKHYKKRGLKPGFFDSISPTSYFAGVILATEPSNGL